MSFFLPIVSTQYIPSSRANPHPITILYFLLFFFFFFAFFPRCAIVKAIPTHFIFYTSTLRRTSVAANISVSQLFRFSIILILWRCYDSAPLMGPTPSGWWQTRGSFRAIVERAVKLAKFDFILVFIHNFFSTISIGLPYNKFSRFFFGSGNSITLSWNIFCGGMAIAIFCEHVSFYIREFSVCFSWFALGEFQIREVWGGFVRVKWKDY